MILKNLRRGLLMKCRVSTCLLLTWILKLFVTWSIWQKVPAYVVELVSVAVISSVADLMSLQTRNVEVMGRESILELRIGALESTLSSGDTRIGELKS